MTTLNDRPKVEVRLGGDERSCRELLALIGQVAETGHVRPERRRTGGVHLYTVAVPRPRATEPGE
jgi:hypothetical protein